MVQNIASSRQLSAIARPAAEFGSSISGWRKVLGLTAEQVADRADISRTSLRKIERGDPSVGFDAVLRVARALGVLDQLVASIDPLSSDLGRARAGQISRKRVR